MPFSPAVTIDGLTFQLPSGETLLENINATFPTGLTALVGRNGSGKTTLLRLISGELTPTKGTLHISGSSYVVRQRLDPNQSLAELLGIAEARAALNRISAGSLAPRDYDLVGDKWDIEGRAVAELGTLGFVADAELLDRRSSNLSGGEATKVALAGARLASSEVTLLDEPTNNLDSSARAWLYQELTNWPGAVIVVSHDRTLLDRVGALVELGLHGATSFGGNYSQYQEHVELLQAAARRQLRDSEAELARAKKQAQIELQRQAQRDRSAKRERARRNVLPMLATKLQDQAEKTAAGKSQRHQAAVEKAQEARQAADTAARTPDSIKVSLPETTIPSSKRVLEFDLGDDRFTLVGPARIRILGDNGSGKSTLLGLLSQPLGDAWPLRLFPDFKLTCPPTVPTGRLNQRLDELDGFESAIAAVRSAAESRTPHEARALLARFLIRGGAADQAPSSMSGGERFRIALARVLFANPAPQLLILDEPSNNLDLASVDALIDALSDYRGALLVVTHDEFLAKSLQVTEVWQVTRASGSASLTARLPD